jgi:hypothetical protein
MPHPLPACTGSSMNLPTRSVTFPRLLQNATHPPMHSHQQCQQALCSRPPPRWHYSKKSSPRTPRSHPVTSSRTRRLRPRRHLPPTLPRYGRPLPNQQEASRIRGRSSSRHTFQWRDRQSRRGRMRRRLAPNLIPRHGGNINSEYLYFVSYSQTCFLRI